MLGTLILAFVIGTGLFMIASGIWWHRVAMAPSGEPLRPGAPAQLSVSLILVLLGVVLAFGGFVFYLLMALS